MSFTKKFAVIGQPIEHSLSPKIHKIFAEQLGLEISYEAICIEPNEFESSVRKLFEDGYYGLNVTLPLKELAFEYANQLSEQSNLCRSVNTLWKEGSYICADSTDGKGLIQDLNNKEIEINNKEIVILGAGGSAKAIIPSLMKENPKRITLGNRTISKAEMLATEYAHLNSAIDIIPMSIDLDFQPDLVINTTSAGVLDQDLEIPNNLFTKETYAYDLSYSKSETPFIQMAKNLGVKKAHDGIGMLINQAALSFAIWNKLIPQTGISKSEIL